MSDQETELTQVDFVKALAIHERAIRAYVRGSLPRTADVDEVMQNVLVVAWKKFESLECIDDFPRWACAIARYQILNFRRTLARDRLVFKEDLAMLLADEGLNETEIRAGQIEALNKCIELLPERHRTVVTRAYRPDVPMPILAKELGKTENAVYQLLWRIRQSLAKCVEKRLQKDHS